MGLSDIFTFSLSGLQAAADRQAVSAHNTANLNTAGFKAQRFTQADQKTGGTKTHSIDTMGQAGPILRTGGAIDLTVAGNGFFQVQTPSGTAYTRDGSFNLDGQGRIADSSGNLIQPQITVPAGSQSVQVTSNGQVSAVLADGRTQNIGQIELAGFANAGGLARSGGNLFSETSASGPSIAGVPGQGAFGALVPGAVEGSNVDIATEMVEQIISQRSFEANTKPIRAADEMLGTLLDIKQ